MSQIVKEIMRGKLTKKFLMELPNNVYLVSNCFLEKGISVYEDKIVPVSKRDSQWKKIVEASADQRSCYIFKSKTDYKKWFKK